MTVFDRFQITVKFYHLVSASAVACYLWYEFAGIAGTKLTMLGPTAGTVHTFCGFHIFLVQTASDNKIIQRPVLGHGMHPFVFIF